MKPKNHSKMKGTIKGKSKAKIQKVKKSKIENSKSEERRLKEKKRMIK